MFHLSAIVMRTASCRMFPRVISLGASKLPFQWSANRAISMADLAPLKKFMENPKLMKVGMELSKDDGKPLHEKMTAMIENDPEIAKLIMESLKDEASVDALKKLMADDTVKKQMDPLVKKYTEELKNLKK